MHLAIGQRRLHQLLARPGYDCHPLGDDLQLACGLALTLDHHCQGLLGTTHTGWSLATGHHLLLLEAKRKEKGSVEMTCTFCIQ